MPKRAHKIDQFHGGINIGADPRDIQTSECVDMVDISLSSIGRLIQLGSFVEHESTESGGQHEARATDNAGYGLFHFAADYKMLSGAGAFLDGTSAIAGSSNFFLLYNNTDNNHITIFQKEGSNLDWTEADGSEDIDLGGGSAVATPVFYYANGAVRIGDASRTANNATKWLGVITPKVYGRHTPQDTAGNGGTQDYETYGANYTRREASVYRTSTEAGTSGVGATNAKWVVVDHEIKGVFEEVENDDTDTICLNAVMVNSANNFVTAGVFSGEAAAGFGFANEATDTGINHLSTTSPAESNMKWGVGCQFREGDSGTWMPSTSTRYKFYITTMYDDNTQESLPQLMAMYGAEHLVPNYTPASCDVTATSNVIHDDGNLFLKRGFAVGQTVSITDTDNAGNTFTSAYISAIDEDEMTLLNEYGGSAQNFGDTESNYAKITITCLSNLDYTAISTADDNVSFANTSAASQIYMCAVGADNACNKFGQTGINLRAWFNPIVKINGALHSVADEVPANSQRFVFGNGNDANATDYGNPRISGFKIYWASNEDGYSTLWEMMEGDFAKGLKALGLDGAGGESGYAPWEHYSIYPSSDSTGLAAVDDTTVGLYMKADWPISNRWLDPPRYRTYFENNFHSHTDAVTVDYFKTAVVVGNVAYIGNVTQTIDGEQEHFPDRILKSPPRQYDKFPSKNRMDAGVNDGDEIIHLATYADRILQFNKNVMYIINVSQTEEIIEDVQRFKGVAHSASVCTTDAGIAWANSNGCYFYDGRAVQNLLEAKNVQLIDSQTWSAFVTNGATPPAVTPMVGYMRDKRELVVTDDISSDGDGSAYRYSFLTKSWTKTSNAHVVDAPKSNFITDYNGDLIYYDYTGDEMKIWSDTPVSQSGGSYITKDFDFGEPAVRKKIYKVYISYKGDGSTVTVGYGINGDNDTLSGQFYRCNADGSSTKATSSTTPFYQ